MLTEQTCYLLTCDGCGRDFEGDYLPHFESKEKAEEFLVPAGLIVPGGVPAKDGTTDKADRHYCASCACELRGHHQGYVHGDGVTMCETCGGLIGDEPLEVPRD